MGYATVDDMIRRFGEKECVMLSDRTEAYTGALDQSVLAGALADAAAEIDGYVGSRYALPLNPLPPILSGYACDIARYRCCGTGGVVASDEIRTRFEDAIKFLRLLAEGKVSLGMPAATPEVQTADVRVVGGRRVFDARSLGDY